MVDYSAILSTHFEQAIESKVFVVRIEHSPDELARFLRETIRSASHSLIKHDGIDTHVGIVFANLLIEEYRSPNGFTCVLHGLYERDLDSIRALILIQSLTRESSENYGSFLWSIHTLDLRIAVDILGAWGNVLVASQALVVFATTFT